MLDSDEEQDFESNNLKKEYYSSIFRKYDKNRNGYIEFSELKEMLKQDEEVSKKIVKKIFKVSDTNDDGRIDLEEFIKMVDNKNFVELFGEYVNSYIRFVVVPRRPELQSVSLDGAYEEQCSCHPLPIGMIIISILEIICYVIDEQTTPGTTKYGAGVTAKMFMYDPNKRHEVWRYLTYMLVHIGHLHLVVNLAVQIMLGIPLEMVHRWWRVLIVYFVGVLMGSLLTSISDPNVYLAGASGGVYSIITAHIASIMMNWNEISYPGGQLFIFILITVADVGTSIYNRYFLELKEHIGYAAHFGGAIAGLLVGIGVLRNLNVTRKEKYIWWISLVSFSILAGVLVILNFVWTEHFPNNG